MEKQKVIVVTYLPSPYQVELFNALAGHGTIQLKVLYLHESSPDRQWSRSPMAHSHSFLADELLIELNSAQLVIFNYYRDSRVVTLLQQRTIAGRPWVFWGERPGFNGWPLLGRIYRRWRLHLLHSQPAPIWGMGKFAVDIYRREFGNKRDYVNLPYFSNLDRFTEAANQQNKLPLRQTFLFSGSLIPRKGFDLLIKAFLRIAREFPGARLRILGFGPLENWARAQTSHLKNRCEFIGFRDWNDLPAVYAEGGVLCVPSRHDGWGLVVPEGLAAGMPVITTDQTGAGVEFIRSRENGWLIKAHSSQELYRAMREAALLNDQSIQRMSQNAKMSIASHSLENGTRRFIEAAENAVKHWRARIK